MAKEYIDKEALLRLVGRPPTITPTTAREDRLIHAIVSTIEMYPAADVVKVVHGRWARSGQSFINPNRFLCYSCSVCGYDVEKQKYNFCPKCGAKMDGGADNAADRR